MIVMSTHLEALSCLEGIQARLYCGLVVVDGLGERLLESGVPHLAPPLHRTPLEAVVVHRPERIVALHTPMLRLRGTINRYWSWGLN